MGKLTQEVFNESRCDGGACTTTKGSALHCGCDPGANWTCQTCKEKMLSKQEEREMQHGYGEPIVTPLKPQPKMRQFETGATRDDDSNKPDYEGFISPLVTKRFGQYMHKHRFQADGVIRGSDNWQKGIDKAAYMKSLVRHIEDVKLHFDGFGDEAVEDYEESICAAMFNLNGLLFELLKEKRR